MNSLVLSSHRQLYTENRVPRWWGAVIDGAWNRIRSWLPIALFAYFAPDAYVLLSAGRLPSDMLAILLTMVCVTLGLTGIGITGQIRRAKRALVVAK